MNSDNPNNVSLQAVLLTMMLEKIDALTNRISNMHIKSDELKQCVDSLTARIDAFELSAKEIKKEIEVKSNAADNEHDASAPLEEKHAKETQISSPIVEAKKEPEAAAEPPQGFGAQFDKKEGEWDCQTCYLRNKPSNDACASCGIGKDGIEAAAAPTTKPSAPAFKPTTFSSPANTQFSFGINKAAPSFGIKPAPAVSTTPAVPSPAKTTEPSTTESKPAETKSLFGNIKPITLSSATPSKPAETKNLFGSTKPITFSSAPSQPAATTSPFASPSAFGGKTAADGPQPKSLFGGPTSSLSANKPPLSFSSFASGTGFLNKKPADSINNSFGAQKSSTFSKTEEDNNAEKESENPEEYVPDAHYEPVIPLPDKVEIVTGEESEQVLFKNRCKLYIFNSDTKEVKERGMGDIKVLFDPEKKTHRVVMRREQVHKICANFRITNGTNISDKPGLKNCGLLTCVDFSENVQTGALTVFYVRFREESAYEEFKKLINDISATNAESTSKVLESSTKNVPQPSVSAGPYESFGDEEEIEDIDEEAEDASAEEYYDADSRVILLSDCKLTLDVAYKSPLAKNSLAEIYENSKIRISLVDDGFYSVSFDDEESSSIFPHLIQNDSVYKKNGNQIEFVACNEKGARKAVTCEFENAAAADDVFKLLIQCRDNSQFVGYENEIEN